MDQEKELREKIRRELEEQEKTRSLSAKERKELEQRKKEEERRRRILTEEREKFFREKKGYIRYVNELGEEEWLTEEEIKQREGYFKLEDDLGDLDRKKRLVSLRLVLGAGAFFLFLGFLYFILTEKTGSLEVTSSLPGAHIFVDGEKTEYVTDHVLEGIPGGYHLIEVKKEGYRSEPRTAPVKVSARKQEQVHFVLRAVTERMADEARSREGSATGGNERD